MDTIKGFEDLNLSEELLKGVYLYGFTTPSKIQINGIKLINSGCDSIIQSQSGTGKTATYLLGVFNRVDSSKNICQGIILTPTRELALQIYDVATSLAKFTKYRIVQCIGGTDINKNKLEVKSAHILIGTLGRLYHMITDNRFNISGIKFMVLDEVDDLLYNGIDQKLLELFDKVPVRIQYLLISATITSSVHTLSKKFMHAPTKILLKNEEVVVDLISQFYLDVLNEDQKFDTLMDLYSIVSTSQAIVFSNTVNKILWLEENLKKNNFPITVLHANMNFVSRKNTMEDFKQGKTRLLLTTDLLSRGIDLPQVNMVINYDLPINKETYIHRIGRCGRFNKKGLALSLIKSSDISESKILHKLIEFYKINIKEMPDNIEEYL